MRAIYGSLFFLLVLPVPTLETAQNSPDAPQKTISSHEQNLANAKAKPALAPKDIPAGIVKKESLADGARVKAPAAILSDIETAREGANLVVTMTTNRLLAPNEYMLDDPPRLVFDLPNTVNKVEFMRLPIKELSIKRLRVRQYQSSTPKMARVVFDLKEGFGTHETAVDPAYIRVVFHPGQRAAGTIVAKEPPASQSKAADTSAKAKEVPALQSKAADAAVKAKELPALQSKAAEAAVKAKELPVLQPKATETAVKAKELPASLPKAADTAVKAKELPALQPKAAETAVKAKELPALQSKAADAAVKVKEFPALQPKAAETAVKAKELPASLPKAADTAIKAKELPALQPKAAEAAVKAKELPALQPKAAETAVKAKELPAPLLKATDTASIAKSLSNQTARPLSISEIAKPDVIKNNQRAALAESPAAVVVPMSTAVALPSVSAPQRVASSGNSRFFGQPLSLDMVDISLIDFFRVMADEGGINIVLDPEVKGNLTIKVVKVPWDQILEMVLVNHGLDMQVEGPIVRIARKATLQEEAKQRESLKKANLLAADLETRVKRLNYAKASAFVSLLADQKTVRGTVVVDDRTNSLIMTDLPSSLDKLIQLVESLDKPQLQVEIESRIVSATRDFARDIGVQFGFVQGNLQRVSIGGPNTSGTIGGTRPSATPTSTFAAGNTSTGRGASDPTTSASASVSTGISNNSVGNFNVNLPSQTPFGGLGISVGNIFDTFLLDAAITAGESKGLAKLISQPKVTAQNNSPATITQGLRFPVQVIANNTVTVQFENAALTLTVTPQITYEGNIVLDLKVENNTPDFGREVNGIPSIRTSESSTRVLVSDGGTTVIGGILIDNESTLEDKVPGLGSLPIIGNLFRRSSVSRSTQEVLFFITPRIIK